MASESLFIRLYLDEDVHPDVAALVREHGFDCESAVTSGMLEKSDAEQLAWAAASGRCLVSFNVKDFMPIARDWASEGKSHAGILVTAQVGRAYLGELTKRLVAVLNSTTADEMHDVLRYF